jgi:hypothetical protein
MALAVNEAKSAEEKKQHRGIAVKQMGAASSVAALLLSHAPCACWAKRARANKGFLLWPPICFPSYPKSKCQLPLWLCVH